MMQRAAIILSILKNPGGGGGGRGRRAFLLGCGKSV